MGRGCREKLDFLKYKPLFSAQNPPHFVFCVEVSKKNLKKKQRYQTQSGSGLEDLNSSRSDVASKETQCLLWGGQI